MSKLALAAMLFLTVCFAAREGHAAGAATDIEAQVRSGGTLRVCVVANYAGINIRDARTGRLSGLDIDMSKKLAANLGVKTEYVETDFTGFMADLERQRCHIAMMGIWVSSGRQARINFSEPYLASGAYVAVARANHRLRSWADIDRPETLVSVINTPDLLQRSAHVLPRATLVPLTHSGADFRGSSASEVMSGRADALIVDYSMAKSLRRNETWARVIEPPKFIGLTEIAYAVPKGEARWLATVNDFVRRAKADGSLRLAANRYGLGELSVPP